MSTRREALWVEPFAAPRRSGAWNQGLDEALLAAAETGEGPFLRFYRWTGPWLSLGYAQSLSSEDLERLSAAGVQVVRRVTGGRAVLHGADLTYGLAGPEAAFPGGLDASVDAIGRGLAEGLRALGIPAEPAPRSRAAGSFDCFAAPAGHELCLDGRKLVGSAQRRRRGALLQHGSIRLAPDPEPARRACGLLPDATDLASEGWTPEPRELAHALADGLGRVLGRRWRGSPLRHAWGEEARSRVARHGSNPLAVPSEGAGEGSRIRDSRPG